MTDAQRARNRARLLSRAAATVGTAAALSQSAATTAAAMSTSAAGAWVVKVAVGIVLASGAGVAYVATRPAERTPAATQTPARKSAEAEAAFAAPPSTLLEVPPEVAPGLAPVSSPTPRPRLARRGPASTTTAAASLAAEVQLMHAIDAALRTEQPERALALLDQRESRDGWLMGEERAAARVVTLCQLGRVESARDEAARFLRDHPRSPLAARVSATCVPPADRASPGQPR